MLVVKDLTFGYGYRRLIDQLSFTLERGRMLHLVGPNGAGKTTLMALIAGLIAEEAGSVAWLDQQDREVDDRATFLEYLPAEANCLYGKMSALANLKFWTALRGHDSSEPELTAELERWGLAHAYIAGQLPVEKFSTGMKRRLALARVALSKTPLWLLDEPLYGLDQKGIATFCAMVASHLAGGGAILIVSHDEAPLAAFSPLRLAIGGSREQT